MNSMWSKCFQVLPSGIIRKGGIFTVQEVHYFDESLIQITMKFNQMEASRSPELLKPISLPTVEKGPLLCELGMFILLETQWQWCDIPPLCYWKPSASIPPCWPLPPPLWKPPLQFSKFYLAQNSSLVFCFQCNTLIFIFDLHIYIHWFFFLFSWQALWSGQTVEPFDPWAVDEPKETLACHALQDGLYSL